MTFYDMTTKRADTLADGKTSAPPDQDGSQSVGFLLVPGFALMYYTAAVEPLRAANLISGKTLYRWWHASPGGKPVIASNGVAILPDVGVGTDRDAD
ncbi:MAG: GlxA family transcriptional regulator, partial [Methyloceanibacter sp.]